jgi:protein TonB
MTKAEFDAKNSKKPAPQVASATPKIPKVGEGIRMGVEGGSTENKTGGANGKALVATDGSVMERYYSLLQQRLRTALQERAVGLSDTLVATAQIRIGADGSLSGARITQSSGNPEYDAAVLAAIAATQMPPHPNKKAEVLNIPFRMKELDVAG